MTRPERDNGPDAHHCNQRRRRQSRVRFCHGKEIDASVHGLDRIPPHRHCQQTVTSTEPHRSLPQGFTITLIASRSFMAR
jgi:hypothetical protein